MKRKKQQTLLLKSNARSAITKKPISGRDKQEEATNQKPNSTSAQSAATPGESIDNSKFVPIKLSVLEQRV